MTGSAGNSCIERGGYALYDGSYTWLFEYPCSVSGTITSWCVFKDLSGTGTIKLKVFRDDGTNFIYVGESASETASSGLNTYTTSIPVQSGDFIGFYHSGFEIDSQAGDTSVWSKSGDITSTALKSAWSNATGHGTHSFGATISDVLSDCTGGATCTDRGAATNFSQRTILNKGNTVTENGYVNRFCIYVAEYINGTQQVKLKVFRQNGTNIDFVAESALQSYTGNGAHTFLIASIAVQAGDYIGAYGIDGGSSNMTLDVDDGTSPAMLYYSGDVTTNMAESSWTSNPFHYSPSIHADYTSNPGDVYIDINQADDTGDGFSWDTAKKTLSAGYTLVDSAGTIHAASGTYSYSGITFNKSWKLSPEDPNAVGYKRVSIGA